MAGLGFKDFAVGEVLTSADVDGYLMQQAVMVFADSGARGSALGTATGTAVPLAEGMVSYLEDNNAVEVYDGASWRSVGGIVAVKSAVFTGTQTNSTASSGSFDITDLTITHAVSSASNRVLLVGNVGQMASNLNTVQCGIAFHDGTNFLGIGDAGGSRTLVGSGMINGSSSASNTGSFSVSFLHTPGSTSSITYTLRGINASTGTQTLSINRSTGDTNSAFEMRAASTLTLMEVAA